MEKPGGQRGDVADRIQDGLTVWKKTQGKFVVEIWVRLPRIEVAGDICFKRPRRSPRAVEPMMMMMIIRTVQLTIHSPSTKFQD